jgi:hypothetical protein
MMQKPPIDYGELVFDLANELRKGRKWYEAIVEICEDTGANEEVLNARFKKSYPNGVIAEKETHAQKLERYIKYTCSRYGVDVSAVMPMLMRDGSRITIIGRSSSSHLIGIRHDTLLTIEFPMYEISGAGMKFAEEVFRKDAS